MFKRFPPLSKEGTNDDDDEKEEETPIMPPNYERIFQPDRSTTKRVVVRDLSHHSLAQASGKRATKASTKCEWSKAPMMKDSNIDSTSSKHF
ncbi:hypothetical protein GOBAR_DD27506 [Gossypium barbadense]|nr:hypothetical protein GOBAR_DD27506 [Gossypium barbadense]